MKNYKQFISENKNTNTFPWLIAQANTAGGKLLARTLAKIAIRKADDYVESVDVNDKKSRRKFLLITTPFVIAIAYGFFKIIKAYIQKYKKRTSINDEETRDKLKILGFCLGYELTDSDFTKEDVVQKIDKEFKKKMQKKQ